MNANVQKYRQVADQARRDELVLEHLSLVKHVIARVVTNLPSEVDVENLESAGILGLVEAATNFDPSRGVPFRQFAILRVQGAVLDELRRNSPLPQQMLARVALVRKAHNHLEAPATVEAIAAETGLTEEEVVDTLAAIRMTKMISWEQTAQPNGLQLQQQESPPENELERKERIGQLAAAIENLSERERQVVTLYYLEDLRLKEISQIMNLSESRLSRILSKAMYELGEQLRAEETASQPAGV